MAIYAPGLPGWAELAKSACELDNDACPYAKLLTKERDPLRYMRLVYAALVKSGATVGELDGYLPGTAPAFFWNAEHPVGETFVVMYVPKQKRFVSLSCSHGPERLYPNGWFETCAVTAARLVYIDLTI
jgi:hypothetical protein